MKKLIIAFAALFAAFAVTRADTSYLLVQGPFGLGGTVETFKWKVFYEPGTLITGQDLLNAVFGSLVNTGTSRTDAFGTHPYFTASNGPLGAGYIDFGGGSYFTTSLTINGTEVTTAFSENPGWNYYLSGGTGPYQGTYPGGSWTYANDGQTGRLLSDGSYDGWLFGSTGEYDSNPPYSQISPPASIADSTSPGDNAPGSGNFSSAASVAAVPEPAAAALILIGLFALAGRRRL